MSKRGTKKPISLFFLNEGLRLEKKKFMKKQIKYISEKMLAGILCGGELRCLPNVSEMLYVLADAIQKDNRPGNIQSSVPFQAAVKGNSPCAETFENAKLGMDVYQLFPQYTGHNRTFPQRKDGKPDTFVYTGDIHAMWLRDSVAQVWPYVQLANSIPELKRCWQVLFSASSNVSISIRMQMRFNGALFLTVIGWVTYRPYETWTART